MSSKQNLSTLQLDTVIHSNSTVTFPNQTKESAIEKFCATPLSSFSCFRNPKGISGSLVYALGGIISDINCKLPNGSENYLPNPTGRIYLIIIIHQRSIFVIFHTVQELTRGFVEAISIELGISSRV